MQYPDISWFFSHYVLFIQELDRSSTWVFDGLMKKKVETSFWGACVQCFNWCAALQLFVPWMLQPKRAYHYSGTWARCDMPVFRISNRESMDFQRNSCTVIELSFRIYLGRVDFHIFISGEGFHRHFHPNKFFTDEIQWLEPTYHVSLIHLPFVCSFIHSFILSFIPHSLTRSLTHSLPRSLTHLFMHACIMALIHSCLHISYRIHISYSIIICLFYIPLQSVTYIICLYMKFDVSYCYNIFFIIIHMFIISESYMIDMIWFPYVNPSHLHPTCLFPRWTFLHPAWGCVPMPSVSTLRSWPARGVRRWTSAGETEVFSPEKGVYQLW